MKQIPLDVQLDDYALFQTWLTGSNGSLLHSLQQLATTAGHAVAWVWGAQEAGKSHLLQACVAEADRNGFRAAYLPLGSDHSLVPAMVESMDALDMICIDEIDRVAGNADWELALFNLFERLRRRGARLVMAAEHAPAHCAFVLPDLVSRFSSGATFRLQPLTDQQKIQAMQLRAEWRGIEMSDDVAQFLFRRVARGNRYLFDLLEQLDRRALAEQKRLTIPFVRTFLAELR